jgi:hypothetical protein
MSSSPPVRKLFRVTVQHVVYVTAYSNEEAEKWVGGHFTEWKGDPPEYAIATRVNKETEGLTPETLCSLPWAASGVAGEEIDKTVEWWINRLE